MSDEPVSPGELGHLEHAHHELCTALTTLRSSVDIIRTQLREDTSLGTRMKVAARLCAVETAVDRLERLAREMRAWHAGRSA